jgi:acetoin utilization protein AcuB
MLVANRMSVRVISVEPGHSVAGARALLARHKIRHLPVLRAQKLVGIVTDRDLRSAPATAKTVSQIMTRKPLVVIAPGASVDEAARLLRKHRIGAMPVVQGTKVVGVLSASDVLDAFVDISGVGEASYRLCISGAKGRLAARRLRHIVEQQRGDIRWMHPDEHDRSKLHLRLKARNIDDVVTAVEAAGFDVETVIAPPGSRA